ncbi:MAG: hypothetical protein PHH00_01055 [Candidatus Nanoarchaeia archaeon]|nr:hypothetical protein [Candidatus Nanoarchaeia archaeon]
MKTNFAKNRKGENRRFSTNNFFAKNRKGAIEMSMTTIVTIVLVVVTLVLALVLIRTIFTSSTGAVEQIDSAIQDQITKLFASEGKSLAIYPVSQSITLKKGDTPKGFAFSVKNPNTEVATFSYTITADDPTSIASCGSAFSKEKAEAFILGGTGTFDLGPTAQLSLPRLIKFNIPETAVSCTIVYNLQISGGLTEGANIFVTIQ